MSPEHAYMAGLINTSNLDGLRAFQHVFPFNPEVVVSAFKELVELSRTRPIPPTDQEKVAFAFTRLLPRCYFPQTIPGWTAAIHFTIEEIGCYTITIDGAIAFVQQRLNGKPTTPIEMNYETYRNILRFVIIENYQQAPPEQLAEWENQEETTNMELSDGQLESMACGKACGAIILRATNIAAVCHQHHSLLPIYLTSRASADDRAVPWRPGEIPPCLISLSALGPE